MQTEQELLAGLLAVENGAGEAVKIVQPQEKNNQFAANHHGMMSASLIGLIIIEPASDAEIEAKQAEIEAKRGEIALAQSKNRGTAIKEKELAALEKSLEKMLNNDFSQAALSYLDKIISQRRRNFNPERPDDFFGNSFTRWGNTQEQKAIDAYEELTGLKLDKTGDKQEFVRLGYVESVGFDFSEWFGCTPDSATIEHEWFSEIGFTGLIPKENGKLIPREFKNPASGVVFDRYRKLKTPNDLKKENPLYYWQNISQMLCCDAPYMQWVAHDCDIKSNRLADKFVIIDFERDMAVEKVLIDSLYKAVNYVKNKLGESNG